MKRKFEEVFEEKIEGHLEDDFKVELFNEDETELIAKSGENFCQTHVKTEINDHGEVRENEDVKIEVFEAEIKQEEITYEDFAEDENHVVKVEKNDQDMAKAEDQKDLKLTNCSIPSSNDALRKVFTTGFIFVANSNLSLFFFMVSSRYHDGIPIHDLMRRTVKTRYQMQRKKL